ncbi:type I restriction-modification system methyltransferase subunit [Streptococcus pneumoniae]|nr:type I restriction-modification system methyltransferase subunit [Streptococcus pneumoniae]
MLSNILFSPNISLNRDLSINKYKEIEYEKVEYEPTEVILKKINDLEKEIQAGLAELEKLLK